MSGEFRVTLSTDGVDLPLSGTFTDDEAETLGRFLDVYERMAVSRPMQEGVPCEVTVRVEGGQAEVRTSLPTQDDLDILFQRLRLFLHEQERTYFNRACSILKGYVRKTPLLAIVKEQQRLFRNSPESVSGQMIFNGVTLSDEARLNDWIYGYQYHGFDERRAVFEAAKIDVNHPAVRRTFVSLLLNKADAITNIAAIAAVFMRRHPEVTVPGGHLRCD